jgi:hypothetical protein
MNNEEIISNDVELSRAESDVENDDVLTVEIPSEIRAGLTSTHTDYPGCKCQLA